jgi:hypothetical protein
MHGLSFDVEMVKYCGRIATVRARVTQSPVAANFVGWGRGPGRTGENPWVLIINDSLCDNGSLRWAFDLARIWLEASWAVLHLALKPHDHGSPLLPPAGVVSLYADTAGDRYRKALPRMLTRAIHAAKAVDVVLVCSEVPFSLPFGYVVARLTRRPFVLYVQSIPEHSHEINLSSCDRPIYRQGLVDADAVLCVWPKAAESAVRLGVSPAKLTVARTGIDVDSVRRRGLVDGGTMARRDGVARLVACGELGRHKGYDILETRPHGSPPAPHHSAGRPPGHFPAAPMPHRCWVPPVGPQDRTSTSDLNNMPCPCPSKNAGR